MSKLPQTLNPLISSQSEKYSEKYTAEVGFETTSRMPTLSILTDNMSVAFDRSAILPCEYENQLKPQFNTNIPEICFSS